MLIIKICIIEHLYIAIWYIFAAHAKLYFATISVNFLSLSIISGICDSLLNQEKTLGNSLLSIDLLCKMSTVYISLYICISATVYSSPHKYSYLYNFLSNMPKIRWKNSSSVFFISSYEYYFSPNAFGPITILISLWLVTRIID